MDKIRLEDMPADFSKRGINPHTIELWEDGKRDDDRAPVTMTLAPIRKESRSTSPGFRLCPKEKFMEH